MERKTGFLKIDRQAAPKRPPEKRVGDWQQIQLPVSGTADALHTQAARCLDCGIPFCHTGVVLGGATSGCPLNNLIPEWNDLVYRGLWRDAYERLNRTNNFPEFTGLVCPAPCEAACTVGIHQAPVTIKSIEYAIVEKAFDEGWIRPEPPPQRTGKRVAVVGSGPAGLACADQLNHVGHKVTVFERADRIGGLLTYGIPNMKLEKWMVERRVELMLAEGVKFLTNTEVGVDVPAADLRRDFDAVVLCTGATRPRDLAVPGRDLQGTHFAVPFLQESTQRLLDGRRPESGPLSAQGKDVIVIGGGDTGTDCVGTALRQGCRSLVQFEILPRPPRQRAPDNPWPQWPRVYKMDYGQEEAAARFGRDPRRYCVMTKAFIGDGDGHLQAVETVDVTWEPNGDGRPSLQELPGTARRWPAQMVLLAMGFLGPEASLLEQLGVEQDDGSNVRARYGDFATSVPSVFAAGDARRGQSLVVWAIREGRGAARECDRYLMGNTDLH